MNTLEFLGLDTRQDAIVREIHDLLQAAYREEARLLQIEDFPPLRRSEDSVRETSGRFFGLRHGRDLVAVAEIEAYGESETLQIASLVVDPSRFRQGLATRLLDQLFAHRPQAHWVVETAQRNEPAVCLYERHGFRITRTWEAPSGLVLVQLQR